MTENIFSTSVFTGLFAYLFERNWHYFMVGVTVLAIFWTITTSRITIIPRAIRLRDTTELIMTR